MNHYEILGVSEDATPEEIKAAYRKKAEANHPDKGGSHAVMSEITNAYDVLKNPQRRQLYDVSGFREDARSPLDIEVQNSLLYAFTEALTKGEEDGELIPVVRQAFENGKQNLAKRKKELETFAKKLKKKRKTIKSSGSVNVVHLLIDKELQNVDVGLERIAYEMEVNAALFVALDEYSEDVPKPKSLSHDEIIEKWRQKSVNGMLITLE